jgi:biotin carboxyl carrier protein
VILELELNGQKHRADVVQRNGRFHLKLDGGEEQVLDAVFPEPGIVQFFLGGHSYEFRVTSGAEGELALDHRGHELQVAVRDPRALRSRRAGGAGDAGPVKITAPMPGKVVRIVAPEGTEVEAGAGVVVIEAMKMQNELKSPKAGKVQKIAVAEGATVNPGDTLAVIE